jgi:uncharacterized protein (DUF1684 family)
MTTVAHDTFVQDWTEWHARHEAIRAGAHGFLAITSLNWLTGQPQRFPDARGAWSTGPAGVVVELDDGEELTVDGATVRGRHDFGPIAERASVNVGAGDAVLEVAKRGGHDILRPRHPTNPLRLAYLRTPAYDPDPRWQLPGVYVPFAEPRPTTVGAAVEGLQHVYEAPGQVEFTVDGRRLTLTAFNGYAAGELMVLFTDATSGITTYAANRSLRIAAPGLDGSVVLDFNRATNLPCAYTEFATCPLPPAENRLPIAVEAGERNPE